MNMRNDDSRDFIEPAAIQQDDVSDAELDRGRNSRRQHSQDARRNTRAEQLHQAPSPLHNHLLGALNSEVQRCLFPHLELVTLTRGEVLCEAGQTLRYVYFPTDSVVSLLYVTKSGATLQVSDVGNEGLLGIASFMGSDTTVSNAIVQNSGHAYRLSRQRFKDEFNRQPEMQLLMLRYTQALLTHISQTAVCNRHHCIDQQLCRWLLGALDRLQSNRLEITQELIANMLGVRREGVTESAGKLQNLGVIECRRGHIKVLDRSRLEKLSCECYAVVKEETQRLLPFFAKRTHALNNTILKKSSVAKSSVTASGLNKTKPLLSKVLPAMSRPYLRPSYAHAEA